MKQKRFRSAISLFKFALQFTWPGGDQSEARNNIKKCEEMMTTEKDSLGERLASANKSMKEEKYFDALTEIRKVWLSYTALLGKPEEQEEAQKQMKEAWKYTWREAKKSISKLLRKKNYDEAYKIVFALGKFIPIIEGLNPKEYFSFRDKIEKGLKPDTAGGNICLSLEGLSKLQQKDGSFALEAGANVDERAMLTGLAIAAYARAGNTLKTGKYTEVLKKAWEFIVANKAADGALFTARSITPHIICTFGISELLNESCDDDVRGILEPCIRYLSKNQTSRGEFGNTMPGIDPLFDVTFASIAYFNASESGIIVPLMVLDKLKELGYQHAGKEGKPRIWQSPEAAEGSPQELFAMGAVLSLMRSTGGNLVGEHGMPVLRKSLSVIPNKSTYIPEGWYLIEWAQCEFPNDQWAAYRKGLIGLLTSFGPQPIEVSRNNFNYSFTKELSALFNLNALVLAYGKDYCVFEKMK